MSRHVPMLAALILLATACGGRRPTPEELDEARARVELAARAAARGRTALELLGVLPTYTCGEPRRTFVGRASESLQARVACVTVTTEAVSASEDTVRLTFAEAGCQVQGHGVSGQGRFLYSGGEERMALTADLRELRVDGRALQAQVGYGTCANETSYWVQAAGALAEREGTSFRVDGRVGVRDGVPLIGSTGLLLDGSGEVGGPAGTDRLTLTGLLYEMGAYAPKEGEVRVETAGGRRMIARFRPGLWRTGQMELTLDDDEPVTVPIVR